MPKFPGIGRRVAERLRVQGFWKDDRPDVRRFCRERGYRPQYVYAWLQDRTPDYDNLRRLAGDFDVPVAWLVSGDGLVADGKALAGRRRRATTRRPDVVSAAPVAGILDVGVLRDAAERIAALKGDLDAALDAFPLPCLWLDETGRVLGVHGRHDPGIPRSLAGRVLREALPPDAAAPLHRGVSRALALGEPVTVDIAIPTAHGTRFYEARIGGVKTPSRPPRRAFVVVHDVTERRARETEYRQLVEDSPNGLCIHREYTIVFCNHAMARVFGYGRTSELLDRDIRALLPGHVAPPPASRDPERLTGARRRHDRTAVAKNGERFTVTALVSPVVWAAGPATLVTVMPPASGV